MLLGCIGDDFTGSSDLANTLAKEGMRVVQYCGVPNGPAAADVEAGVVAIKTRSIDPVDAVSQSLQALAWLRAQGCTQFVFKYCSTFDSTERGNIGPVCDALAEALGSQTTIVCPAFPGTGRSVYQGHLFVNDRLLNESGMEDHPLTPMKDADLRRVLTAQCQTPVAHISAQTVFAGADSIRAALQDLARSGPHHVIVDAIRDADLRAIGEAARGQILITGGSGIALGLPTNFRANGQTGREATDHTQNDWTGVAGPCAILSGSCSTATRAQLAKHMADHPGFEVTAQAVLDGNASPTEVAAWVMQHFADRPDALPVVFSSADPAAVHAAQARLGKDRTATAVETFFADTAVALRALGVTRIITAGGETSGAVVEGLALTDLAIGPEIDPGVPALRAGDHLALALKSGNFGATDFFTKAARALGAHTGA